MAKKEMENKWYTTIKIIIMLAILSFIVSWFFSSLIGVKFKEGNVALIPIKGAIVSEKYNIFGQETADSATIVRFIEDADKNPRIKAIIFEINSPGGSPVASEEIANAILKSNKTTVAWIREVGASGGYWVAASCDKIVANRMSMTGSIGVIASYLEFSGLLKDYNVTYQRLVAGKYKDIGSPLKKMNIDEEKLLQDYINKLHGYFIGFVAENRNLPEERVEEIATGMIYLGEEAKELGLIDVIGGKEEAKKIIEEELNITAELAEYKEERTLMDLLGSVFSEQSFFVGKGIGSSLLESRNFNKVDVWT